MLQLESQENLILDIMSNFSKNLEQFNKGKNSSIHQLFKSMKKKGRKVYNLEDETVVIGKKKCKQIDGLCIINHKNGCFIGELKNNEKTGFAYSLFSNGLLFKGTYYKNHKKDGKVYDNKLEKIIYDGEWKNDRYHGQGRLICEEGHIYDGTFHDGQFQGEGKMIWENGDEY